MQSYCRGWSIPPDLEKHVTERFPLGGFLVCGVCAEFDEEKRVFWVVKARSDFWFGSFRDHINSRRHKNNCVTKSCWEEVNELQVINGDAPRKRRKK